jgi:hypothetical protein
VLYTETAQTVIPEDNLVPAKKPVKKEAAKPAAKKK